jgi:hypothetical protein
MSYFSAVDLNLTKEASLFLFVSIVLKAYCTVGVVYIFCAANKDFVPFFNLGGLQLYSNAACD